MARIMAFFVLYEFFGPLVYQRCAGEIFPTSWSFFVIAFRGLLKYGFVTQGAVSEVA